MLDSGSGDVAVVRTTERRFRKNWNPEIVSPAALETTIPCGAQPSHVVVKAFVEREH